jgi:Cu-Zn family superoxide dismutase
MTKQTAIIAVSLAALLGACSGMGMKSGPAAVATLEARSESQVSGTVEFAPTAGGVRVQARVAGLTPGEHGFHIHEVGDCSAVDATSAKGHFNPAAKAHGHHGGMERHAGDMPNLVADAGGNATYNAEVAMLALTDGPNAIVGRSVVVHADPDDYKSQPAGNSGKRIACGVIRAR